MNKKQKTMLARILAAAALLVALHFLPLTGAVRFVAYLIPYLIVGYDILLKAGKGIRNRQVFDECFLMAVATVGAIALALYEGSGDYTEAIAVMLFYQVGEWFQSYAVGKSRRNISDLMDIRPDYANVEQDGQLVQMDPDEVTIGTVLVVQPGEKVPIDGLHHPLCPGVYPCSVYRRPGSGPSAAPGADGGPGSGASVGGLDLPGPYLPGHQLSLRPGDLHPPVLLRRHRRGQQGRGAGEGVQLPGDPLPDRLCGL